MVFVFVFVLIKRLQERKGREKEKYSQIGLDGHICTLQDYQNYHDNDPKVLPQIKPANTQLIPARSNCVPLGFVGCFKKKKGQRGKKGGRCTPNEEARDVCTALELHNSKRRRAHLTTDFIFLLKKVGVDHETAPRQITVALGLNFLQLLTIREGVSAEGRCLGFHSPTPKVWS